MRLLFLLMLLASSNFSGAKTYEGYADTSSVIILHDSIYRVEERNTEFLILLTNEHAFFHFPKANVQPERMKMYLKMQQSKKTRLKFEVNPVAAKILRITEI